jgi:superfamily II DNA or RNA helicase
MVRGGDAANYLKEMTFDLVILDEAHRARREKFRP